MSDRDGNKKVWKEMRGRRVDDSRNVPLAERRGRRNGWYYDNDDEADPPGDRRGSLDLLLTSVVQHWDDHQAI
jgi:hypothetical protein